MLILEPFKDVTKVDASKTPKKIRSKRGLTILQNPMDVASHKFNKINNDKQKVVLPLN